MVQKGKHLPIAAEIGGAISPTEASDRVLIPVGFDEYDIGLCSLRRRYVFNQLGSETLHA